MENVVLISPTREVPQTDGRRVLLQTTRRCWCMLQSDHKPTQRFLWTCKNSRNSVPYRGKSCNKQKI